MAKTRQTFVCQNCGAVTSRWQGRCESCGEWNTIVEEGGAGSAAASARRRARDAGGPSRSRRWPATRSPPRASPPAWRNSTA